MTDGQTPAMKYRWSSERAEISAALVAFQSAATPVAKGKTAKVEKDGRLLYTYEYADLADVIEHTKAARAAAGLAIVQFPTGDANGITVVTTVLHKSGQWMEGELTLRPNDTKPQTIGSLITYLRRYCYSAALGICTEADDDGAAASNGGNEPRARKTAAPSARPPAQQSHPATQLPRSETDSFPTGGERAPTGEMADGVQKNGILQHFKKLGWPAPHVRSWLQKHAGVQGVSDLTAAAAVEVERLLSDHETQAA